MTSDGNPETGSSSDRLLFILAVSAILSAPFLVFLRHHRYEFWAPESLISLGAFVAVGGLFSIFVRPGSFRVAWPVYTVLLLLAADIQIQWPRWFGKAMLAEVLAIIVVLWIIRRHAHRILSTVFVVVALSTAVLALFDQFSDPSGATARPGAERRDPLLIHLVLDEHIGINGIPTDIAGGSALKAELERFYLDHGFTVFRSAYSPYVWTLDSVSTSLNFVETQTPNDFWKTDPDGLRSKNLLVSNRYFESLSEKGYRIQVFENTWIDLCGSGKATIVRCDLYRYDNIQGFKYVIASPLERSLILMSKFFQLSFLMREFSKLYLSIAETARKAGVPLPSSAGWSPHIGPIATLPSWHKIFAAAERARPGDMIFGHLLDPHKPYSLDANCVVRRPMFAWDGVKNAFLQTAKEYTEADRERQYRLYFDQIRCVSSRLGRLFEILKRQNVYDDAIIVIHGDHGSRISPVAPIAANAGKLTDRDLRDLFSALFAVKLPGRKPAANDLRLPVWRLVKSVADNNTGALKDGGNGALYYRTDADLEENSGPLLKVPLPDFLPKQRAN